MCGGGWRSLLEKLASASHLVASCCRSAPWFVRPAERSGSCRTRIQRAHGDGSRVGMSSRLGVTSLDHGRADEDGIQLENETQVGLRLRRLDDQTGNGQIDRGRGGAAEANVFERLGRAIFAYGSRDPLDQLVPVGLGPLGLAFGLLFVSRNRCVLLACACRARREICRIAQLSSTIIIPHGAPALI